MIALMAVAALAAQDRIFSGPQKGEKISGFKVVDVNGEHKGKEIDYVEEFKGAPTLLIFIHEVSRPAAQLFRRLDDHAAARKEQGLRWLHVLLTEDLNKMERYAPIMQGSIKLKGTIGISIDGREGPGKYGLNKEVLMTVVLAKENAVVESWAILSPNETDAPKIIRAIDALLGVESTQMETPKGDLEARVAALEKEVRELREIVDRLRARGRPLGGAPPKDAQLNGLVRKLIQMERTNEEVDATIKEIREHIKDSDDLKKQAVDALRLLLELKYGTEHAQAQARELLGQLAK
jgi:hypothetical protein